MSDLSGSTASETAEPNAPEAPGAPPEPAPARLPEADAAPHALAGASPTYRPSFVFLGALAGVTLVADLATKRWAETRLELPEAILHPLEIVKGYLGFSLARNKGGAWGLLQGASESIRKPFFLAVSVLAIIFIVSLYRRLAKTQLALRWGLPLVLGGALGNLADRIRYGWVIDFIDAHARWGGHEHHWPTFNVADVAICIGVGLMAIDMLGARRAAHGTAPTSTGAS